MDFGVNTLSRGPMAGRDGYGAVAEKAEALGFGYLTVNDHVVVPGGIDSRYPYTEEGNWPGSVYGECFEQIATLAFVAGRTSRIRLLSSVMVLPHRQAVLAAKMLATADVLSGGRLIVGCGVGWMKEEFEAIGAPAFAERGKAADEYLQIFKELWSKEQPSFQGQYASFSNIAFEPKPVQKPHPPIWIGGHSKAALRRTARYADGWHPVGANPAVPLPADEMRILLDELKRLTEAEGRDFGALTISYKAPLYDKGETSIGGNRRPFSGTKEQIADDIRIFAGLGVSELIFDFRSQSLDESTERMERFAADVMPLT